MASVQVFRKLTDLFAGAPVLPTKVGLVWPIYNRGVLYLLHWVWKGKEFRFRIQCNPVCGGQSELLVADTSSASCPATYHGRCEKCKAELEATIIFEDKEGQEDEG